MAAFVLSGIALVIAGWSVEGAAHGVQALPGEPIGWTVTLVGLLGAIAVLYFVGVRRLWRRAGARRGIRNVHLLRFAVGWLVLAGSLLSPIDAVADRLGLVKGGLYPLDLFFAERQTTGSSFSVFFQQFELCAP
jgi:putative membrane protein